MSLTEGKEFTVLHSRSVSDLERVQADLVNTGLQDADLFLRFVRDTSALAHDQERLLDKVREFTFMAFPQATHMAVVTLNADPGGTMDTLMSSDRNGASPVIPLSRTLVRTVIRDGVALLYSHNAEVLPSSESLQISRIDGAICAPLWNREESFGVIQIDVRQPSKGTFTRKDVDRLALFAHYLALALDNLRLYRDQLNAFESTIEALLHSLLLKDPDAAAHSERVQTVATCLGRALGIAGPRLDSLSVAALLHDMGKQGVRDAVLFKPARLSESESAEMNGHARMTQGILDRIRYPAHLKNVATIAAYHHEKLDGSGPYGIPGDEIPFESRIISVADCFDALISARAYKDAMPVPQIVSILEQGQGREWDPAVVAALKQELEWILIMIYNRGLEQVAG